MHYLELSHFLPNSLLQVLGESLSMLFLNPLRICRSMVLMSIKWIVKLNFHLSRCTDGLQDSCSVRHSVCRALSLVCDNQEKLVVCLSQLSAMNDVISFSSQSPQCSCTLWVSVISAQTSVGLLSCWSRAPWWRSKARHIRSHSEDAEDHFEANDLQPVCQALKKLCCKPSFQSRTIQTTELPRGRKGWAKCSLGLSTWVAQLYMRTYRVDNSQPLNDK